MGLITKSLICRRMCPPKDQTLRFAHTHSVHSCISLFSIPCFFDGLLLLVFLFSSTFFCVCRYIGKFFELFKMFISMISLQL